MSIVIYHILKYGYHIIELSISVKLTLLIKD